MLRRLLHVVTFNHLFLPVSMDEANTVEQCSCGSIIIWMN